MRIEIRSGDGTTVIEVPVMGIGEGDVPRLPTVEFVPIPADTTAAVQDSRRKKIELSHHFKCGGDADDEAETPGERAERLDARDKRNAEKAALDARTVFRVDNAEDSRIRSLVLGRDGPMVAVGGTCCKLTPIGIVNLGEILAAAVTWSETRKKRRRWSR